MSDNLDRPPVYEDGGVVFYRASALGGCKKALALARQGFDAIPPPANMLKVFEAGHEAERQAWAKGILKGVAQEYIQLVISDNIRISGHLDGWQAELVGTEGAEGGRASAEGGRGRTSIAELKSQSADVWGPIAESHMWRRYSYQISCYMHATGAPLEVIRVLRDAEGNISDEAREEFLVPPVSLADIRRRVLEIELLARKDLDELDCEQYEFPCPFFYTHKKRDDREVLDDDAAVVMVQQYLAAKDEAKVADARLKASRKALDEWMGDKKKVKLSDRWLLTVAHYKEKEIPAYTRKPYTTLRITEIEDKDAEQG